MYNNFIDLFILLKSKPYLAYLFALFNSFMQTFFPPYPGDMLIALLGYLSTLGILNGTLLLITTLFATFISSIVLLYISYHYSDIIKNSKYFCLFFNLKQIQKFESWYKKIGPFFLVISKFIPGINSVVIIASGIFKINLKIAIFSIGLSTIIQNSMLFLAGKIAGNNLNLLKMLIKQYSNYILLGMLIFSLTYILIKRIIKE